MPPKLALGAMAGLVMREEGSTGVQYQGNPALSLLITACHHRVMARSTRATVWNQMRVSLMVLAPAFVLSGTLGILGFGELRSAGRIVIDPGERLVSGIIFIVLGVLMGILRFTLLRRRRSADDAI